MPGLNCQAIEGDSPLLRRAMGVGTGYFSFLFDTAGLYHFKSRFRPQFESRYVCAAREMTLGSAIGFVGLLNVLKLDLGKTLRIAAGHLKKWTLPGGVANRTTAVAE